MDSTSTTTPIAPPPRVDIPLVGIPPTSDATRAGDDNLSAAPSMSETSKHASIGVDEIINGEAVTITTTPSRVMNDADIPLGGIPLASDAIRAADDSRSDDTSMSETSEHASTAADESINGKAVQNLEELNIAKKEEHHVNIIRIVTFTFIIVSAIVVCGMVYFFTKGYDKNEFELEYESYVEAIQSDTVWEVQYNFALLQQLSASVTSEILASSQVAPNITLPRFEVMGGFTDGMSGIMSSIFIPLLAASKLKEWEAYSVENQGWLEESARLVIDHAHHLRPLKGTHQDHETDAVDFIGVDGNIQGGKIVDIPNKIWVWNEGEKTVLEPVSDDQLLAPFWQSSPAEASTVNVDMMSDSRIAELYNSMRDTNQTVMSSATVIGNLFDWMYASEEKEKKAQPHAFLMEPVYATFSSAESEPIGLIMALTSYRHLFESILPHKADGIYVVLTGSSACGTNLTFLLNGPKATFVGFQDLHEGMDEYEETIPMELYSTISENLCFHDLHIYPAPTFVKSHLTNKPILYTSIVALAFVITSICFLIYERLVTKRENTKTAALQVVASLFPATVHDQVLKGVNDGIHGTSNQGGVIATFFPYTTVLFADIAGFTAWSSSREPEQVFQLLETVYGAMDQIALRRGVFKVETVGDCYVAACGLPEPREDHAVVMTRFARDCQLRMASLSRQLEVALGPDTADLSFRIGMHSGPVTGGVLRGQNARFQLFGDTMNQASRMESTGIKDRIQMSATTARILIAAGKEKWIEKRSEKVDVKGKGWQETYFFKKTFGTTSSTSGTSIDDSPLAKASSRQKKIAILPVMANKNQRLVSWNTEVLARRVKAILKDRDSPLDDGVKQVELSTTVADQLHKYVHEIAFMYRDNPFHNYEHASHVTLSMEKMLSRVTEATKGKQSMNRYQNDISSDRLAQFAVVYSALIHDVDHTGVSNGQLVKEKDRVAVLYDDKSPAENHSIHLAWRTLMQPQYKDLVECLCPTEEEKDRLKKLVTKAVLATDLFDDDLRKSRNERWEHVFGSKLNAALSRVGENGFEDINSLKVTIVLEHLIQASDVAHTMQHWHVFVKWNERLFHEMFEAYNNGRLGKNPLDFWYSGELSFFDHYVIPLAKKLKECNAFGVSCDEFLNYAEANRGEWEMKGKEIVEDYAARYQDTKATQIRISNNDQ